MKRKGYTRLRHAIADAIRAYWGAGSRLETHGDPERFVDDLVHPRNLLRLRSPPEHRDYGDGSAGQVFSCPRLGRLDRGVVDLVFRRGIRAPPRILRGHPSATECLASQSRAERIRARCIGAGVAAAWLGLCFGAPILVGMMIWPGQSWGAYLLQAAPILKVEMAIPMAFVSLRGISRRWAYRIREPG